MKTVAITFQLFTYFKTFLKNGFSFPNENNYYKIFWQIFKIHFINFKMYIQFFIKYQLIPATVNCFASMAVWIKNVGFYYQKGKLAYMIRKNVSDKNDFYFYPQSGLRNDHIPETFSLRSDITTKFTHNVFENCTTFIMGSYI